MRLVPVALVATLAAGTALGLTLARSADPVRFAPAGFGFELEARSPGTPQATFDLFTGDVSPWWDHTFAAKPLKLVLEPKPGGGFYEIFDEAGHGVKHAEVLVALHGEELVFRGPLGFGRMGVHLDFVHRLVFVADGEGTKLTLTVHGSGEVAEGVPEQVQQVWKHFLHERFEPYAREKLGG
jgi:hypothetical protein